MILRPDPQPPQSAECVPAWDAIARTQTVSAHSYDLVRQPDHARLSGELARHFSVSGMPPLDEDILSGISLHDEGWSDFDCGRQRLQATPGQYCNGVPLNSQGKPLSFLDIKAGDFLEAWRGSIAAAEALAPVAGLIVSGHFHRLAKFGLDAGHYPAEDAQPVREFVEREEHRRERLLKLQTRSPQEIEYWTDVLQFFDVLSLYLCCGSHATVQFPQRIAGDAPVRLQVEAGTYVSSPQLFAKQANFSLHAHSLRCDDPVPLQWSLR